MNDASSRSHAQGVPGWVAAGREVASILNPNAPWTLFKVLDRGEDHNGRMDGPCLISHGSPVLAHRTGFQIFFLLLKAPASSLSMSP